MRTYNKYPAPEELRDADMSVLLPSLEKWLLEVSEETELEEYEAQSLMDEYKKMRMEYLDSTFDFESESEDLANLLEANMEYSKAMDRMRMSYERIVAQQLAMYEREGMAADSVSIKLVYSIGIGSGFTGILVPTDIFKIGFGSYDFSFGHMEIADESRREELDKYWLESMQQGDHNLRKGFLKLKEDAFLSWPDMAELIGFGADIDIRYKSLDL